MSREKHDASVIVFTGPHGAGKDTVENLVRDRSQYIGKLVRHITRPAGHNEIDGESYYFIDDDKFGAIMDNGGFLQSNRYPDGASGLSYVELHNKLKKFNIVSTSMNYHEAAQIKATLAGLAIRCEGFFVAPCGQEEFLNDEHEYIEALRRRLINRGRPSDNIDARLAVAKEYRQLYIDNLDEFQFVDNSDGNAKKAAQLIVDQLDLIGHQ